MNKTPPVSVVIPVYGRSTTLKDAVESVFLQDYGGYIEIIIIDDASPPFVYDSLKPYLSRVTYYRLQRNVGVSAARNSGIHLAKGDYIAFLDSDDIFLPSKISNQITSLIDKDKQVSHSNEFWFKKDRFINQGKKHQRFGGKIFCNILDICRVSPSSLIVKKDVFNNVGLFNEALRVCEDYEWCIRCSLKYEFDYLDKRLLIKRAVTDNSLSASIKYIESIRLNILENLYQKYKDILTEEEGGAMESELNRKKAIVKNH